MRPLVTLMAFLALGAPPVMAEPEAIVLRFDPFELPDLDRLEYGRSTSHVEQVWSPVLKATLVAGEHSLVSLGGTVLQLEEETHGYRLLEVRAGEAVFEKGGMKIVLTAAPEEEP